MALRRGIFKKAISQQVATNEAGSTPNHRNEADQSAPLGIATTRYEDRIAAAIQRAGNASVKFDTSQAVCGAGILFLLPALLSQGLLKPKKCIRCQPLLRAGVCSADPGIYGAAPHKKP